MPATYSPAKALASNNTSQSRMIWGESMPICAFHMSFHTLGGWYAYFIATSLGMFNHWEIVHIVIISFEHSSYWTGPAAHCHSRFAGAKCQQNQASLR